MSPERRVLLASVLSAALLMLYAQLLGRQANPQPDQQQTTIQPLVQQSVVDEQGAQIAAAFQPDEPAIRLESPTLSMEIGTSSAAIRSIIIKGYSRISTNEPLEFGGENPALMTIVNGRALQWTLREQHQRRAVFESKDQAGAMARMMIELDDKKPTAALSIQLDHASENPVTIPVAVVATWGRSDELSGRNNPLELVFLTQKQQAWQRTHLRYFGSQGQPKIVPRGTLLATIAERYFCLSMRPEAHSEAVVLPTPTPQKTVSASIGTSLALAKGSSASFPVTIYAGPRDFFALQDAGFSDAFALGILSRIGLVLMIMLKAIASVTKNYGAAVIVLSVLITCGLSPFTLMSIRSMKKMRALQPKMDQLKKKYQKDSQRMNKELFALFREHRVSPLSGCLPMLLPLPIFFAIWSAISHVIELRGASFLWIKDLSLPDRLLRLPIGFELNLLPIIMMVAMFFQSRLSQQSMPATSDSPTTKMMSSPLMSVVFGIMFYQFPSSLVLYWLTNTACSLAIYQIANVYGKEVAGA